MVPALTLTAFQSPLAEVFSILSSCVVATLALVDRRGHGKSPDPRQQLELHTLLNSIPDMLVLVAAGGVIIDANEATSRLVGISRDRLVGATINTLAKHLTSETSTNIVPFGKPAAIRALEGEEVLEERRRLRHPATGEEVELLVSAKPICNQAGETVGALMIGRDVTEITQLHKRIADIERHQAIGHVAAGIAHDFNNTLQTISQAAAVLQMGERPLAEQKYFLEMIQTAVRRGAEVIGRIRDYLRSGTSVLGDVDVRNVMQEAAELTIPLLRSKAIKIQKELKASGPVQGNKADLLRMFTNLIVNSVQAMPQGGKIILGCQDEGNTVHAWVCDTGSGISPEVRGRIFNPYFTTKAGGTGLGLSGAQKIMLDLGGNISFQSEPNEGTQFDLRFPKVEEEERKTA